jgi:hypothetical protein
MGGGNDVGFGLAGEGHWWSPLISKIRRRRAIH